MSLSPAYPSAFHCEHTPSKSRVFALVEQPGQAPTLAAVLSVTDAALAEQACRVLELVRVAAPGASVLEEIGEVAWALPDAPLIALVRAIKMLSERDWPVPAKAPRTIDERPASVSADAEAHTPDEGRLSEMKGSVVRVCALMEVNVHDADLLLHAADASGRMEDVDEYEGPDDPERLVDAVLCLALAPQDLPGGYRIYDDAHGDVLDSADDELAEWRGGGLSFAFETGWRSHDDPALPAAG